MVSPALRETNYINRRNTFDKKQILRKINRGMEESDLYHSTPVLFEPSCSKLTTVKGKFKNVSDNETIVNDFSCALKKDLLLHGRLFFGMERFYFASNIFGFETKIEEKWSNVISIEKAKLANIIPNTIRITTTDAKYTFASFSNRSYAYEIALCVLKNHTDNLGLTVSSIKDIARRNLASSADKNKEDNLRDHDHDIDNKSIDMLDKTLDSSRLDVGTPTMDDSSLVTNSISENAKMCECKHLKNQLCLKVFHVNIDDIFNAIYDDSSNIMKLVFKKHNLKDYTVISRKTLEDNSICRTSSHVLPKAFMGQDAKTTTEEIFPCSNTPNIHYHIISKSYSEGVSYSDHFEIYNNTCLYRLAKMKTVYKASMEVRFNAKAGWSTPKNIIAKSTLKTATSINTEIINELGQLFGKSEDIPGVHLIMIDAKKIETIDIIPNSAEMIVEATKESIILPTSKRVASILNNISKFLIFIIFLYMFYVMFSQHNEISRLKNNIQSCRM